MALRSETGRRAARRAARTGKLATVTVLAAAGVAAYFGYHWWESRNAQNDSVITLDRDLDDEFAQEEEPGQNDAPDEVSLIAADLTTGQR